MSPTWCYETGSKFHAVSAAIEFAALNLRIKHLIVMGHSGCGAVKARGAPAVVAVT